MEQRRNWLGWIAVGLAGLALLVALSGRFDRGERIAFVSGAPSAPSAPQAPTAPEFFERGRGEPHFFRGERGDFDREFQFGRGEFRGEFGPGHHGFGHRGFGPLGFIFGLIGGLTKLVAFGLLAWLLLKLFQQRRQGPPAPTTPAGHDPRVE